MNKEGPKIIDSHAHVNFYVFANDKDQVLMEAKESGTWVINVGSNFETSRKALEIAQDFTIGVYSAIGIHPIHVSHEEFDEECMLDLARNNSGVVGIGETGLDYFHINRGDEKISAKEKEEVIEKQKKLFIDHLELARKLNLPVILHCRSHEGNDAYEDMLEILSDFKSKYDDFDLRGVIHCYTGNLAIAKMFINLGFCVGFTGVITFTKDYDEVVGNLPMEKILIETDCPYLAPEPKRGKRNEPKYVRYVSKKIAELKSLDENEVNEFTVQNTRELFGI